MISVVVPVASLPPSQVKFETPGRPKRAVSPGPIQSMILQLLLHVTMLH